MPHAYIAGPLFNEGEHWFDEQIEACARRAGFTTFLPHRDGVEGKLKGPDKLRRIFDEDVAAIDAADVVVANLNGLMVDDGTAWEIGYAYARGKRLVGIRTDWRATFEHQVVNLMIECSLHHMARSLTELEAVLQAWAAGSDQ